MALDRRMAAETILRRPGFGITEFVVAAALMAGSAAGAYYVMKDTQDAGVDYADGRQLAEATRAFQKLLEQRYGEFHTAALSAPLAVPLQRVIDDGLLGSSFPTTNSLGQTYSMFVRARTGIRVNGSSVLCEVDPKNLCPLDALVVTSGGRTASDAALSRMQRELGGDGGKIATTLSSSNAAVGDNWSIPASVFPGLPWPGAGHAAARTSATGGTVLSEALSRYPKDVPGSATMHQSIDLNGFELQAVRAMSMPGASAPFDAARLTMVNALYGGRYSANSGNLTIDQRLDVAGFLAAHAGAQVQGAMDVTNGLTVGGTADVGRLNARGSSTVNGRLDVTDTLGVGSTADVGSLSARGNSSVNGRLDVNGYLAANSSVGVNGTLSVNGTVYAQSVQYTSDRSHKRDIGPLEGTEGIVNGLDAHTFIWRSNGEPAAGFIAQEVETLLPVAVKMKGESTTRTVDLMALLAVLWQDHKRLTASVRALTDEVQALRSATAP